MRFSIIVPVYNAEKYIEQSIQSVLSQTNQDYEIVLVNDGSTDRSKIICDEFVQKYPEKIRVLHQENQGQLLTRNNGIQFAKGEYCIFLDADDLLVLDALEQLEDTVVRYDNPDMVIYSFYYDGLTGDKEKAKLLFSEETCFQGEDQKNVLYEKFFTTTLLNNVWTKAVKRSVFDKEFLDYNKYANLRCSEDRLHSMGMVTNAEKVVYIITPLYEYKLIPNSISRTFHMDAIDRFNTKVLYAEELSYMSKWGIESPEWKNRMDAGWIMQTWYVLDKFYNAVKSKEQKKQILHYPWTELVPKELTSGYENNPYLSEIQKECWTWIVSRNYDKLESYFCKKAVVKKLRNVKRKIVGRK